jgi:hypothetical protein
MLPLWFLQRAPSGAPEKGECMKYVKILGLAAVAAAALMTFVGASMASATVLCSTTTTPCNAKVASGTRIGYVSEGSLLIRETGGETLDTCKKSKITGENTSSTTGTTTTLDWEECTFITTTVLLGKLEVTGPLTGTSNGTIVSDAEDKVTMSIPFFGSCVYGHPAGVSLGTLTEGKPATFDANSVTTKRSGSSITCPQTSLFSGTYTMNEPENTTIAVETS